MPTWPFRSASPIVSMRPVSVTRPAPMRTPIIPNRGRVEISEGMALAVARATSSGVSGRVVIVVAAMMTGLSSRADRGGYRKTRSQFHSPACIIQRDFYRNALHDLGEIAGRVVGRQQGKLRSAGGSDLNDLALDDLSRVFIDADFRRVADFHVGELRLAIIGLNPLDLADE